MSHVRRSFHAEPGPRLFRSGSARVQPARRRRAATLVVTVLMAVAVASIAMIVVRLVVNSSAESTRRFAFEAAARSADGVREEIRAELITDPLAPYNRVLDSEHPRVCTTASGKVVVQPGESWPAACGTTWGYQQGNLTVGARITVPSPEDPAMTVYVASRIGNVSAGYADRYLVGGRNRPVLYTGGALEMTELRKNTTGAVVDGYVYATGAIDTTASGVTSSSAFFATEATFNPSPTGSTSTTITGRRFAAASASAASETSPSVMKVRSVYASALPSAGIRSTAAALEQIACPSTPARQVTALGATYASQLCLHEGAVLVNTVGDAVSVPDAVAFLVLPAVNSDTTVDVYVRTTPFTIPGLPCEEADIENEIPACDLAELSTSAIAAGAHPGGISGWSALGTFPLPASGVIATDADTHVGLCGQGFTTGSCASWSGGTTGAVIERPFTIVVGSPSAAKDLYLSGPLTAGNGHLGAVVTGAVVVPYWARPVGGDVQFDISLAVVGDTGQAINTIPSAAPDLPGNTGGTFTITGAVGAVNLQASAHGPVFSGYRINATLDPDASPPLFALPSLVFERDTSRRMTEAELAWLDPVHLRSTGRTSTNVDLTWTAPQIVTGESVADYEIEYRKNSTSTWTTFDDEVSTSTSATVTGLAPGSTYQFRVITVFDNDQRITSRTLTTKTAPGVPAAPTALRQVANTSSSITLAWDAPSATGGSRVTNYIVEYRSQGSSAWTTLTRAASTSTTATVTGLNPAGSYEFRVAAVNANGTGVPSAAFTTSTAA